MTDEASIIRSTDSQDKKDEGEESDEKLQMLPLDF
jgi:hypothetical protein